MAIAFRAAGATASGNTPASLTFAAPTGTVSTDVVLVVILVVQAAATDAAPTITPPSGWTLAATVNDIATSTLYGVVYRGLGSASFGAWSFSGITEAAIGWAQGYTGVDNTTPMDATAVGQANASSTTATAPSITTVTANAWLVGFFMEAAGSAGVTWSAEFGTHRKNDAFVDSLGGNDSIDSCDAAQAVAGASGTKSATFSGVAAANIGILAALRPATSTAVTPGSDTDSSEIYLITTPQHVEPDTSFLVLSTDDLDAHLQPLLTLSYLYDADTAAFSPPPPPIQPSAEDDYLQYLAGWPQHVDDAIGFAPVPPLQQPSSEYDFIFQLSTWIPHDVDSTGFVPAVVFLPPEGDDDLTAQQLLSFQGNLASLIPMDETGFLPLPPLMQPSAEDDFVYAMWPGVTHEVDSFSSGVTSKTYYMTDYNPTADDYIYTYIDLGNQTVIQFINGRFTTTDPVLQAYLDAKSGLATLAQWQNNYQTIPRLGGHAYDKTL